MDDMLLEAIAAAAGTEVAFSNGWRYGAPHLATSFPVQAAPPSVSAV